MMVPSDLETKTFVGHWAREGEMGKRLTLPVSVMKITMPTAQHSGHTIWAIYNDLSGSLGAKNNPKSRMRDL